MNCDPSYLADAARCLDSCSHGPLAQSIKTYLLCQYANAEGCTAPAAPTDIDIDTTISSNGNTVITWQNSDVPERNEIWKSVDNGGIYAPYDTVAGNVNTYTDVAGMADGEIWYYQVRACNSTCCSAFTEPRGVAADNTVAASGNAPFLVMAYGNIDFSGAALIGGFLDLRRLRAVALSFVCAGNGALVTVNLDSLEIVGSDLDFNNCANLTAFSAPVLNTAGGTVNFNTCGSMTSLSLPSLGSCNTLSLTDAISLNSFTVTTLNAITDFNLSFSGDGTLNVSFPNLATVNGNFSFGSSAIAGMDASSVTLIGSVLDFSNCTAAAVNFAALTTVADVFGNGCLNLTSINFTSLQTTQNLNFSSNPVLINAVFPALTTINGTITVQNSATLTTLAVADGCSFGQDFFTTNCTNLQSLTIGVVAAIADGFQWDFSGCNIAVGNSAAGTGVDGVLRQCANQGLSGMNIDLSGGTNAPPSAAGLVDAGILSGNGCSVVTN